MLRLALTISSMAAPSLAGVGVIIVLVAGYTSAMPIIAAAVAGALLGIPVSYLIAKALYT